MSGARYEHIECPFPRLRREGAAKRRMRDLLPLVQVLAPVARQLRVLAHPTTAAAATAPAARARLGLGRGGGGRRLLGGEAVGELLLVDEPHPLRIVFFLR